MISLLATFIYVACDMAAIGAGTIVLLGLFRGELRCNHTAVFLRCALATSIIGLLFRSHQLLATRSLSMLAVYVSALAIVSWRKFHLVGLWRSTFLLTMSAVMYISVLIMIAQGLLLSDMGHSGGQMHSSVSLLIVKMAVAAFSLVACALASRRYRARTSPRWRQREFIGARGGSKAIWASTR